MSDKKQKLLDLERCNNNINALNNIRDQLEKLYPSDEEVFQSHIEKVSTLLAEISLDEIGLHDALIEELS